MEQVTTLCDLEACAVVFGPGDTTPLMWPSRAVAETLIHKFESMSEFTRSKNVTDQVSFLKEKGEKLQATLDKMKEDNEETLMGSYMYQIESGGKVLSDFEPSELNRLINFMLKKYKIFSQRLGYIEEGVSHLNSPLENKNGVDFEINTNNQSLNQQPLLDLDNQCDRMIIDFDNNVGSSMRPSPHENLNNGGNMFEVFGGFNNNGGNNIDRSMVIQPYSNPSVGVGEVFPQGVFEGFNGGSTSRVFDEGKYGGFNGEKYSGSAAFPPNMLGVSNGENYQSNLFPQGDLQGSYGIPTNDGSGMTMPMPLNINEDNNNGRHMRSFNANFADGNNFNNRFL
ncbi:uncharacterized protein LOC131615195 [Vicia villosa]|uniref:uncharacterized protein LOC131615195 n=1 Tax=Vicia villosa TaxID=3911 RepID=UPI00273B794E|nr:uncharacterized protein LOC131615195 [Vicia villosa]